jgi:hypothetical protein
MWGTVVQKIGLSGSAAGQDDNKLQKTQCYTAELAHDALEKWKCKKMIRSSHHV